MSVRFVVNLPTDLRLAQLKGFLLTCMEKGMHTGMILIDLRKAFDTMGHKTFLEKMTYLGFKTTLIK